MPLRAQSRTAGFASTLWELLQPRQRGAKARRSIAVPVAAEAAPTALSRYHAPQRFRCTTLPQRFRCTTLPQRFRCTTLPQRFRCTTLVGTRAGQGWPAPTCSPGFQPGVTGAGCAGHARRAIRRASSRCTTRALYNARCTTPAVQRARRQFRGGTGPAWRSSQLKNSRCHSSDACGLRIQWFSSGKITMRAGTPLPVSTPYRLMPCVAGTR